MKIFTASLKSAEQSLQFFILQKPIDEGIRFVYNKQKFTKNLTAS